MKICLMCEGSYPYVVGGVSSWVQQLIVNFPEYEFHLYCISADVSQKGKYVYEFPANVSGITEIFLNDVFIESDAPALKEVSKWEIEEIRKLMLGNPDKWEYIFNFFVRDKRVVSKFLMSKYFYQIAEEIYNRGFEKTLFVDFLWSLRSMYLTLFHVLNNPPPKADLYHSVSTGYAGVAASCGKYLYGTGYILTEHGIYTREREEEIIKADWVHGYFKNLWIDYFKSMSMGAYKYADKIIALFEGSSKIQQELGAAPEKALVIPNGIDIAAYQNIPVKNPNETDYTVGAVIRFSPIKDIKTLLQTFHLVKTKLPNAKFYIIGPTDEVPEYYEECMTLLNDLGTKDVTITGRTNVADYLYKMDVIVLSSISEGQPLSIMEAMATGIPCVSTNVGCCKELFEGRKSDLFGLAGLLAPVMNYEKLAEQIVKIVTNKELQKKMSETAKKRIKTYYSQKQFVDSYKELYHSFDILFEKKEQSSSQADLKPKAKIQRKTLVEFNSKKPKTRPELKVAKTLDITNHLPPISSQETVKPSTPISEQTKGEVTASMRKKQLIEKLDELYDLNQLLEKSANNHKKEIIRLSTENKVKSDKVEELTAQLEEHASTINQLNYTIDELSLKSNELAQKLIARDEEKEKLVASIEQSNFEIKQLILEKEQLGFEKNQLTIEIGKLINEKEQIASERVRGEETYSQLAAENERLKSDIAQLVLEKNQPIEANERLQTEINQLKDKLKSSADFYVQLESQKNELERKLNEALLKGETRPVAPVGNFSEFAQIITGLENQRNELQQKLNETLKQLESKPATPVYGYAEFAQIITTLENQKNELQQKLNEALSASSKTPEMQFAEFGQILANAHTSAQNILNEANQKAQLALEKARNQTVFYKNEITQIINGFDTRDEKQTKLQNIALNAKKFFDDILATLNQ